MNKRLQMLMQEQGLTAAKFADILDIQPSAVSHLLSGRNKPGFDLLSRILATYPEIDPRWLILGEGTMFADGDNTIPIPPTPVKTPAQDTVSGDTETIEPGQRPQKKLFSFPNETVYVKPVQKEPAAETPAPGTSESPAAATTASPDNRGIRSVIIFYEDGTFEAFGHR